MNFIGPSPGTRPRVGPGAELLLITILAGSCASSRAAPGAPAASVPPPGPSASSYQLVSDQAPSGSIQTRETKPAPKGDAYSDALAQAYKEWKGLTEGKNADYIPVLAKVDPGLYGIALVTVQGAGLRGGGLAQRVLDPVGVQAVHARPGGRGRGLGGRAEAHRRQRHRPAVQLHPGHRAVSEPEATAAGQPVRQRWRDRHGGSCCRRPTPPRSGTSSSGMYSAFAGRPLSVNEEVYKSESETNTHNRAIVALAEGLRGDQGRSGRGPRPLHPAVLGQRQRARPGHHGRHAGQRRAQPDQQPAGGLAPGPPARCWR